MFKIYDGRNEFYQWDLNRKLIVEDKSITQVHFCNRTGSCSLMRDVYEVNGMYLVDVPNILLQDNWDIKVYGFDSSYTKHSKVYNVVARTRPENYVYSETEQLKWEQLEERIDEIEENGISDEVVANAVNKYMEENGVNLDGYATEEFVNEAIAAIDIPEGSIILTSNTSYTDADYDELWSLYENGLTKPVFINGIQMTHAVARGSMAASSAQVWLYGMREHPTKDTTIMPVMCTIKFTSTTATTGLVNEVVFDVEHPTTDLTGYATETFVTTKIAEAQLGGEDVDLTGYATEKYVDEAIEQIELTPGPAGKDGYTPIKGVDYFDGQDGKDGQDGAPGADGKDYVLTEADKQEIAGMVEVTGGGGSGEAVEEVYIGTEAPTDSNIKIWINPDEESGSVAVDGTTIIQNADGTISTTMGGGKVMTVAPTVYIEAEAPSGSLGWTKANSGNSRYAALKTYDVISAMDTSAKYYMDIECYNQSTSDIATSSGYLLYEGGVWKAYDLYVFDDQITGLGYTASSQGFYLSGTLSGDAYYNTYWITKYVITKEAEYEYTQIDSRYLNVGDGLTVSGSGTLLTTNAGITTDAKNNLLMANNTGYTPNKSAGVALGQENVISGNYTVAIGYKNSTSALDAPSMTLIGSSNKINNTASYGVAVGRENALSAMYTYAFGVGLSAASKYQTVYGKYNILDSGSNYNVIIGNGTDASTQANGLTIASDGTIVTQGTISNAGADYAEYFEWADGNPDGEDRVGLLVCLDGNKIRLAQFDDDDILGVVSGTATILGDDAEWAWQGKYLRDDFGRLIMEEVALYGDEGEVIGTIMAPKINPDYDATKEYISRAKRAEWDAIGMMGKLYVRHDGTACVGDYVTAGADGVATLATGKSQMRVMERISDEIVRVLLK